MKKLISTTMALMLACSSALAVPWTFDNLERHVQETNFSLNGNCSGTLIDNEEKLILTAYHCVQGFMIFEGGEVSSNPLQVSQNIYKGPVLTSTFMAQAEVVATDSSNDIALIQIMDVANMPYEGEATISSEEAKVGDDVYVVGNPLGFLDNTVTKGMVSATHRVDEKGHIWQIDANSAGGNSGGAAYNSDGELIGVLSRGMAVRNVQGYPVPLGFNFIVPYIYVNDLLGDYHNG